MEAWALFMNGLAVPKGFKQTELGFLPDDWDTPLLDSISHRGSGHTPNKKHPEYWNGDIRWISLKDSDALDTLYIEETAAKITPAGIANSSANVLPAGTVVMSRDAGVGKSAIMKIPMAVSQHFIAWVCGSELDNQYLYYLLQFKKPEFERIAMGNTIKTIGLSFFRAFRIQLPNILEQRAIATALSDVDALIAGLDQLFAKKCDIKRAAMQQLLTGEKRLPGFREEWKCLLLGDLFCFKNGLNKGAEFFGSGTPIVNYMDVYKESSLFSKNIAGRVNVNKEELKNFDVRKGDVFFTRTSETTGEIGLASVILDEPDMTVFSGFLLRARPKDDRLSDSFKAFCFRSEGVRKQIVSKASYTTRALTNGRLLSGVVLKVPSKPEQTAIAAILSDMDAELTALEQRRDKTRALKQGMMHELLTGKTRLV
jgi:type I restriction enzyme S subunit